MKLLIIIGGFGFETIKKDYTKEMQFSSNRKSPYSPMELKFENDGEEMGFKVTKAFNGSRRNGVELEEAISANIE